MSLPPLAGWTVGVTADRRWEEQAELLVRRGARIVHGPSIRTLPLDHDEGLRTATESVIAEPPDVTVLSTGLGVRAWVTAAESLGRGDALVRALGRSQVLARGPKAAGAALTAGLDVAWRAPSERSSEIARYLGDLGVAGKRVVVQRDGAPRAYLAEALADLGAEVVDVPVYRWVPADDRAPVTRLAEAVVDGRVNAVTFTSSPGFDGFLDAAEAAGIAATVQAALNTSVLAVCIGPVCADQARLRGIRQPVEPHRGRIGAMVQALVHAARDLRIDTRVGDTPVGLQGSFLTTGDGDPVELSPRERGVVAGLLAARPGTVVAKGDLLRSVWRDPTADPHVVEVAVARLRKRLQPAGLTLEAVHRRGYRLIEARAG